MTLTEIHAGLTVLAILAIALAACATRVARPPHRGSWCRCGYPRPVVDAETDKPDPCPECGRTQHGRGRRPLAGRPRARMLHTGGVAAGLAGIVGIVAVLRGWTFDVAWWLGVRQPDAWIASAAGRGDALAEVVVSHRLGLPVPGNSVDGDLSQWDRDWDPFGTGTLRPIPTMPESYDIERFARLVWPRLPHEQWSGTSYWASRTFRTIDTLVASGSVDDASLAALFASRLDPRIRVVGPVASGGDAWLRLGVRNSLPTNNKWGAIHDPSDHIVRTAISIEAIRLIDAGGATTSITDFDGPISVAGVRDTPGIGRGLLRLTAPRTPGPARVEIDLAFTGEPRGDAHAVTWRRTARTSFEVAARDRRRPAVPRTRPWLAFAERSTPMPTAPPDTPGLDALVAAAGSLVGRCPIPSPMGGEGPGGPGEMIAELVDAGWPVGSWILIWEGSDGSAHEAGRLESDGRVARYTPDPTLGEDPNVSFWIYGGRYRTLLLPVPGSAAEGLGPVAIDCDSPFGK